MMATEADIPATPPTDEASRLASSVAGMAGISASVAVIGHMLLATVESGLAGS